MVNQRESRRLQFDAPINAVHWIGQEAYFALGDGAVAVVPADPEAPCERQSLHDGAVLCACVHPDGKRLLTGGDDGKLCAFMRCGQVDVLFAATGKWIDHLVSSSASGAFAAGVGKQAVIFAGDRESHRFTSPSSVAGLALDGKGRRLALSHYGGVTLHYLLAPDDKGVPLKWAGSHLAVTLSPQADYVVSAMQENALHGWRMPEKIDLRMDGYPAKTRSFSWDKRGRWLATSGANAAIVWPFVGKLGPQGKPPLQLGAREALATAVAFHPGGQVLAIGYGDGAVLAARLDDGSNVELAATGAAVSALSWRGDGLCLAVGCETGSGAIIPTT